MPSSGEGKQEHGIDYEVKLTLLFCFVLSVAFCHRPTRAAEQYALLSSRSIRARSHCSVLATGRDELVLPSDQTHQREDKQISRQVQFIQSRLQLCHDSRQFRASERRCREIFSSSGSILERLTRRHSRDQSTDPNSRTVMRQSVDTVG